MSLMEQAAAEMRASGERMVKVAERLRDAAEAPAPENTWVQEYMKETPTVFRVQLAHGGGFLFLSSPRYLLTKFHNGDVGLSLADHTAPRETPIEIRCDEDEEAVIERDGSLRLRKRSVR